jgi:hypothetical protein
VNASVKVGARPLADAPGVLTAKFSSTISALMHRLGWTQQINAMAGDRAEILEWGASTSWLRRVLSGVKTLSIQLQHSTDIRIKPHTKKLFWNLLWILQNTFMIFPPAVGLINLVGLLAAHTFDSATAVMGAKQMPLEVCFPSTAIASITERMPKGSSQIMMQLETLLASL